ncbi:MAG: methyltransferase domain-containing protein [Anaerolineales bacterium]|nr:methyltransferase domain-containing protein [Anaerolineales bacterium]
MKKQHWIIGGVLIIAGIVVLIKSKAYQKLIDATARKPSGWLGWLLYGDPKPHYKSFQQVLEKAGLMSDDTLLDVCCGGGTLLSIALETVHRAAGLDYSADMVALATENNSDAVAAGRLDVRLGDACALPWDDETFNVVTNVNAFTFIMEPEKALQEAYRVLKPGGRFVVVTPARRKFAALFYALWYSALTLYDADELGSLMNNAGFTAVESYLLDPEDLIGFGIKE